MASVKVHYLVATLSIIITFVNDMQLANLLQGICKVLVCLLIHSSTAYEIEYFRSHFEIGRKLCLRSK